MAEVISSPSAPSGAASAPPPPPGNFDAGTSKTPPPPPKRRVWRWLGLVLLLLLISMAGLLGYGWWWSGTPDSLARTLQLASRYMPAEQKLETRDVRGSLRQGGSIGQLAWSNPTLKVQAQDTTITWQLGALLNRQVLIEQFHVRQLELTSTPDTEEKEPLKALESLTLPVRIALPFQIDNIIWHGPPEAQVQKLQGRYDYEGGDHQLAIQEVQWADGHYQADVRLQGAAPMALTAQLKAQVQAPAVGGESDLPGVPLQAQVDIKGHLAGEKARLEVKADVLTIKAAVAEPATPTSRSAKNQSAEKTLPAQAQLVATIDPWLPQPVHQALAQLQAINVAAFWPQGPHTLLSGTVQVTPQEGQLTPTAPATTKPVPEAVVIDKNTAAQQTTIWQLNAELKNEVPGPWDRQKLPLRSLNAQAAYDGSLLQVSQAQLDVGDGTVNAQAEYAITTHALLGQAKVERLNPAALHTALAAAPLQGSLSAEQSSDEKLSFQVDLNAVKSAPGNTSRPKSGAAPLRIQTLQAKGSYQNNLLLLSSVNIDALQALVSGTALQLDTQTWATQGKLQASVPGAALKVDGAMASTAGKGTAQLQLASATQMQQWLTSLPGMDKLLGEAKLAGNAELDLQWSGGWQGLLKRFSAPAGAAAQPTGLTLKAELQAPQLSYSAAGADAPMEVKGLQLSLNGSPENVQLSLKGDARMGDQQLQLQTQIQGGLSGQRGAAASDWQARIAQLNLLTHPGKQMPGPWKVELLAPLSVAQRTQNGALRIQADAGQLQISPPAKANLAAASSANRSNTASPTGATSATPQAARIQWENTVLAQNTRGIWGLQSKGLMQSLPLSWADAFAAPGENGPLTAMGLGGDLLLNGQWDINTLGPKLLAHLVVERASGDLRVSAEESSANVVVVQSSGTRGADAPAARTLRAAGVRARIKQARLTVDADGNQFKARFDWDSERAGTATATASTELTQTGGNWAWAANAPINASLQAKLPDIGVWSAFAPPAWRVSGTLQAQATLSGTRLAPRWQGDLQADQLAIRSLLDGIDLHDGKLRGRLQGNSLEITELSIQGGSGNNARILGYSGNLTAAPRDGGTLTGKGKISWADVSEGQSDSGLTMDFAAQAKALQVLVRSDRQVSVSGDLQAKLDRSQLTLRGKLTTDRATIILPEQSAPTLGSDVVVRSAAKRKEAQEQAARDSRASAKAETKLPPDVQLSLNLGPDFALQGHGITTRLTGDLEITGSKIAGGPPQITGEIRTEQGRYRAWGQSLDVENGLIRFNGPYDNPSLDILAIRPNIAVRAGVQVSGPVSNPRVSLYSDPDLPDAEKLSWVVMGRDTTASGAEAAILQQAALALLSGGGGGENLAGRVGLDEIGFKGAGDGSDAEGAALTLGKRLSKDLYVTYEQSLSGAVGTLYIFYDLSRSLTLRGQTGATSAVDLVYTVRKD